MGIAREIPFSVIQFSLYEEFKHFWARKTDRKEISPYESAACGSASGAISAALTTPIDVVKTRLMLGKDLAGKEYKGMIDAFQRILKEEGGAKFFSGLSSRVTWIGIGGFVFFGSYESVKHVL